MEHHHDADTLSIHTICKDLAVRSACLVDQQNYEAHPHSARMTSYVLLWSAAADSPLEAFGRKAEVRQVAGQFDDFLVRTDEG